MKEQSDSKDNCLSHATITIPFTEKSTQYSRWINPSAILFYYSKFIFTKVLKNPLHLSTFAYFHQDTVLHIQEVRL